MILMRIMILLKGHESETKTHIIETVITYSFINEMIWCRVVVHVKISQTVKRAAVQRTQKSKNLTNHMSGFWLTPPFCKNNYFFELLMDG